MTALRYKFDTLINIVWVVGVVWPTDFFFVPLVDWVGHSSCWHVSHGKIFDGNVIISNWLIHKMRAKYWNWPLPSNIPESSRHTFRSSAEKSLMFRHRRQTLKEVMTYKRIILLRSSQEHRWQRALRAKVGYVKHVLSTKRNKKQKMPAIEKNWKSFLHELRWRLFHLTVSYLSYGISFLRRSDCCHCWWWFFQPLPPSLLFLFRFWKTIKRRWRVERLKASFDNCRDYTFIRSSGKTSIESQQNLVCLLSFTTVASLSGIKFDAATQSKWDFSDANANMCLYGLHSEKFYPLKTYIRIWIVSKGCGGRAPHEWDIDATVPLLFRHRFVLFRGSVCTRNQMVNGRN